MLQAQLLWLTSALAVLYSAVVGHERHAGSRARLKVPAAQPAPQTALLVRVQFAVVTVPAQEVQVVHGAVPLDTLKETPATQGVWTQACDEAFQL